MFCDDVRGHTSRQKVTGSESDCQFSYCTVILYINNICEMKRVSLILVMCFMFWLALN